MGTRYYCLSVYPSQMSGYSSFWELHLKCQKKFNFCRSRIHVGQTSIEPVSFFIWRAAIIAVFLVHKVGRMETSFRYLPTICQFMFSFSGRHTMFPLVDLRALYVFLYGNTYEPSLWTWFMHFIIQSSGLVLSVSSSIPQELSLILSLEIVSNWDKKSWFSSQMFSFWECALCR